MTISELFDPREWVAVDDVRFDDITFHIDTTGAVARIAIDRPEVRNAFRPQTIDELHRALTLANRAETVGSILLTGNGPSPKDGGRAFCSGGDQRIRGRDGYQYTAGSGKLGTLHVLEVQRLIRFMPEVVIAVVPGWVAGGGHSLHVVCDLTIASAEFGRFKQTDADVASFDGGYGSALLARQVGQKLAREIFFLAREYDADRALQMGAINAVVPHADLERTALEWGRKIAERPRRKLAASKLALNAADDGIPAQEAMLDLIFRE